MWFAAKIIIIVAVCSGIPISDVPCQVPENLRGAYDLCADGQDCAEGLPRRIVVGPDAVTALGDEVAEVAVRGFRGKLLCGRERSDRAARDTVVYGRNAEDSERPANGVPPKRPSDYREFRLRDTTHMAFELPLSKSVSLFNGTVQLVTGHTCLHLLWRQPDTVSYWTMNTTRGQPCEPDSESEDYVVEHYPMKKLDQPSIDGTTAVPPVNDGPHDLMPPYKPLNGQMANRYITPFYR